MLKGITLQGRRSKSPNEAEEMQLPAKGNQCSGRGELQRFERDDDGTMKSEAGEGS